MRTRFRAGCCGCVCGVGRNEEYLFCTFFDGVCSEILIPLPPWSRKVPSRARLLYEQLLCYSECSARGSSVLHSGAKGDLFLLPLAQLS